MAAMIALREFRHEIQRTAREVVKRRLVELLRSIGLDLESDKTNVEVEEYANPYGRSEEQWDGSWAWVAVRLRHELFHGYFGLWWRHDGEQLRAGVVATFAPIKRELHKQLREAIRESGIGNVYDGYKTEISLWEPLLGKSSTGFAERLEKHIDDWIRVWTGAGGLKGLMGAASGGSQ